MDDVRGDFLGPPHGTTSAAVIANKNKTETSPMFMRHVCFWQQNYIHNLKKKIARKRLIMLSL